MPELMKGHTWRDRKHKMTYPAYVETKHDEIRCHVKVHKEPDGSLAGVEFLSYAGKHLHNLHPFARDFAVLADEMGILEFDCGIEVNHSFNDTYRYVRSKGVPPELADKPLVFFLFDVPTVTDATFEQRLHVRHHVVCNAIGLGLPMQQPETFQVANEAQVEQAFVRAREAGYEGLMVKSAGHLYARGKRTDGWLKVKPTNDADGVIVDLIEAVSVENVPLGRIGSVRIRVTNEQDGKPEITYATPHGIPHALGKDMFDNPDNYLGKWAEFKYMEIDRQGGYRHPTFHRVREAKA